jgi:DNA-binding IclR family transcriptional regulator
VTLAMEGPAKDALRFIENEIDTVPHIEALLLLWDGRPGALSPAEVARRLFVTDAAASRLLADLHRRRLVAPDPGGRGYAYDPAWDTSGELMARVAETYRRHLITVATLIHSKASPAVREFARAFESKKKE